MLCRTMKKSIIFEMTRSLPNQDPSSLVMVKSDVLDASSNCGRTTEDIVKQLPYANNAKSAARLIPIWKYYQTCFTCSRF